MRRCGRGGEEVRDRMCAGEGEEVRIVPGLEGLLVLHLLTHLALVVTGNRLGEGKGSVWCD